MTDESPDMRSDSEPGAAASGGPGGDESVDVLLDRASSLASEMAAELGDGSIEQRATRAEETLTERTKSLDEEVEQMDALAKQLGEQVGDVQPGDSSDPTGSDAAAALDQVISDEIDHTEDSPSPFGDERGTSSSDPSASGASVEGRPTRGLDATETDVADPAAADSVDPAGLGSSADRGVSEGTQSEVPDFMMDFLAPDEPEAPKPSSENGPHAAAHDKAPSDADGTMGSSPPGESSSEDGTSAASGALAKWLALGTAVTRASGSGLCALLEIVDRPFAWVPVRARSFIGLVALATLATSAVVFAIAVI